MLAYFKELIEDFKFAIRPPVPQASEVLPLMWPLTTSPSREREGVHMVGEVELSPECYLGHVIDGGHLRLVGPLRFRYQDSAWVRNNTEVVKHIPETHWILQSALQNVGR